MWQKSQALKFKPDAASKIWPVVKSVAIVGIVLLFISLFFPHYGSRPGKITAAQLELLILRHGLTNFRNDVGRYPTTSEGLQILLAPPSTEMTAWRGPYIERLDVDPWGNSYSYSQLGSQDKPFDLRCAGPDGKLNTSDDLTIH